MICLGRPDWYSARLEEHGVTVHHLGMRSPRSTHVAGVSRPCASCSRPSGADVVQSWMYFANVLSALVARRARYAGGVEHPQQQLRARRSRLAAVRLCRRRRARRMTQFVINCSRHSSALHDRLGYSAVPNAVIPNGYDSVGLSRPTKRRALLRGGRLGSTTDLRYREHRSLASAQGHSEPVSGAFGDCSGRGVPLRCLLVGRGLGSDNRELAAEMRRTGCARAGVPLGHAQRCRRSRAGVRPACPAPAGARPFPMSSPRPCFRERRTPSPTSATRPSWSPTLAGWCRPAILCALPRRSNKPGGSGWTSPRNGTDGASVARKRIVDNFTFEKMAEAYAAVWRGVAEAS